MILIADSGSTKTDWIAYSHEQRFAFQTIGMNPYFYNAEGVTQIIRESPTFQKIMPQIKEIYFYGSGCYTTDKHEIITNGLSALMPQIFISVESDVNAAAYATCGTSSGFCCILGTGSNITYYDGESVFAGKHGLGYVLGDEGSASYFGKKIIFDYLSHKTPEILARKFNQKHPNFSKEFVLKNLYNTPHPNKFLASFSPFMYENLNHPYIIQTLIEGFQIFIDTHIKSYQNYRDIPCNFVGTIAWIYQDLLKKVCQQNHITIGKIIQKPIDGLVQYVLKKEGYI